MDTKKISYSIPKIFNCYWDMSPLSYLSYLTIVTFHYYNPIWTINVYVPIKKCDIQSWSTNEQKDKYTGINYWTQLINLSYVNVIEIDFENIGFKNNISEVIKSDYLRWHLLGTIGGIWSDFDILYINSIENFLGMECDFDTLIFNIAGKNGKKYYPIGFFMSKAENNFFLKLKQLSIKHYNHCKYQCIGTTMININWPMPNSIVENFPENKFLIENKMVYLPFEWNQLDKIFKSNCIHELSKKTVGIHWFNGSSNAKEFQNNLEENLDKNACTISILANNFRKLIDISSDGPNQKNDDN